MSFIRTALTLIFALLIGNSLFAQLIGGSSYMQGDYLEVGVSPCASYGTPGAPPGTGFTGGPYHANAALPGLGFVADSETDGWLTSTPPLPPYCGDYFVPGSPVEGFGLMIGGSLFTNTNGFAICSSGDIPGSVTGYSTAGDTLRTIWQGGVPGVFGLKQETFFPRDKLYFVTEVTLTNTSFATFNDIYYNRQVDPDNDQPWSGTYATDNVIVSQPTAANSDALVTATGVTGCFLGLGARNFAARVCYGGFFLTNPQETYCGLSPYSLTGAALSSDIAISVSFYFQELIPGDSLTFSFAYILDESYLEEALSNTEDLDVLVNGVDIGLVDTLGTDTSTNFSITICPGDTLDLELEGGEHYTWTWTPDAGLDTTGGSEVVVTTDTSITYTVSATVPCGPDIGFQVEVIVDNPAAGINISPDISYCPGDSAFLNSGGLPPGASVIWSPPDFLDNDTIVNPQATLTISDTSITYIGTFTSANGCEYIDSVMVTTFPEVTADAGPDLTVNLGSGVNLDGSGGDIYLWTPSDLLDDPTLPNPYLEPEDTFTLTYILEVSDINGCMDWDTMKIHILDDPVLIIPNAFTPNADGINDVFHPVILGNGTLIDFQVFNRWGELIFMNFAEDGFWDGTKNGVPQEMGTYIVVVRFVDPGGDRVQRSATVTLLR